MEDYYDPYNVEGCPAFVDAKRKLRWVADLTELGCYSFKTYVMNLCQTMTVSGSRMVLGTADYQTLPSLTTFSNSASSGKTEDCMENYLLTYLKVRLLRFVSMFCLNICDSKDVPLITANLV